MKKHILPFSNSISRTGGLGLVLACMMIAIQVGAVSAQERASDMPGFTAPAPLTRVLGPVSEQATSPSQTTVGILNADGGTASGAIFALNGTGLLESANISVINESGSTPTLQELLQFDVVLIWSNSSFSDPTATGNVLADYVDGGGSVVIATYALTISTSKSSNSWWIGGRFEDPGYMPLLPSTNKLNHSYVMDMSSVPPGHPIFDGIESLTYGGNSNYTNSPLNADATLLATDTNGNNLVAVNTLGTVAAISI